MFNWNYFFPDNSHNKNSWPWIEAVGCLLLLLCSELRGGNVLMNKISNYNWSNSRPWERKPGQIDSSKIKVKNQTLSTFRSDDCYVSAFQSLLLLAHLIRNGSERVVTSAREHLYDLRSLESYHFVGKVSFWSVPSSSFCLFYTMFLFSCWRSNKLAKQKTLSFLKFSFD